MSVYSALAWLPEAGKSSDSSLLPARNDSIAGHAFLVAETMAVTCAHVIRDHLGLGETTPVERPRGALTLIFPGLGEPVSATVADGGWCPDVFD